MLIATAAAIAMLNEARMIIDVRIDLLSANVRLLVTAFVEFLYICVAFLNARSSSQCVIFDMLPMIEGFVIKLGMTSMKGRRQNI